MVSPRICLNVHVKSCNVVGSSYSRTHCICRDLKPENILLDESMHIRITDFGTAKIIEEGGDGKSILSSMGKWQFSAVNLQL